MSPALFAIASALAAWAGMAALCFQSPNQRHRLRLSEQTRRQRGQFIAAGSALLALSLFTAFPAHGASFGIVLWLCQAGVLGLALSCCLPYWTASVMTLSRVSACAAPALLFVGLLL